MTFNGDFNGLVQGKFYRKAPYLVGKSMVSGLVTYGPMMFMRDTTN